VLHKVVQTSLPRTGSTLLSNILAACLDNNKPIFASHDSLSASILTKTHNTDLLFWKSKYPSIDLYFAITQRSGFGNILEDYNNANYIRSYSKSKIIEFDYDKLCISSIRSTEDIALYCVDVLQKYFSFVDKQSIPGVINRVNLMNAKVLELRDMPFAYYNEFFHVHGGHRRRS
jgi:hypothetical protein